MGNSGGLTSEQEAAVQSPEAHLVVTAAAGAGKTRVLVGRFLKHVLEDEMRPDEVLAITFTNRAADSMKSRVVQELQAAKRPDLAQIAETGPIQTVHSFCDRLLRENSLEAGVDPEFELAGPERQTQLMRTAVWQAIATLGESSEFVSAIIFDQSGKTQEFEKPIDSIIQSIVEKLRSSGIDREDLEDRYSNLENIEFAWRSAILDDLPAEVNAVRDPQKFPNDFGAQIMDAYKRAGIPKPSFVVANKEFEQECLRWTLGIVQLACEAWRVFEVELERLQVLDFAALESRAVKLVASSQTARSYIAERYKALLVDEAQDLNPIQYELLTGMGIERSLFVGDAQQSIYAFRHTDAKLLTELASVRPHLRLSRNYRSAPGILKLVDKVFNRTWQDYHPMSEPTKLDFDVTEAESFEGIELWKQQTIDAMATAEHVSALVMEGERPANIAVLYRTAATGVKIRAALENLDIPCQILGSSDQFFTQLEIRDLANCLTALTNPADDFAMLAMLRSPVVGLSLDAIVRLAAAKPLHEAIKVVNLQESDDLLRIDFNEWFWRLHSFVDRFAAWEVIAAILEQTPLLVNLGKTKRRIQVIANVRKLLQMAIRDSKLGPAEFADQIREIQSLKHREGSAGVVDEDEDFVNLSTVHNAKGLEWDVVVLADTFKESNKLLDTDFYVVPEKSLIVARPEKGASMYFNWIQNDQRGLLLDERTRVHYVGLTRARRKLCICVNPTDTDSLGRRIVDAAPIGSAEALKIIVRESRTAVNSGE